MPGRSKADLPAGTCHVTVERADVTALPFESGSYDAVTSYLMLHHVIEWLPALAEAARVPRPGGHFVGYDLTDTRAARLIHCADGSPFRTISHGELRDELALSRLLDIEVERSFAGYLMRFQARKPNER